MHHESEKPGWSKRVRLRCMTLLLVFFPALGMMGATIATAHAQAVSTEASEEYLKAAYLLKFFNYVEWPANSFAQPESPYVIGVVNDDVIADELARLVAGRAVNNRKVVIKRLHASDAFSGVHMLFISRAEKSEQPQILKQSRTQPVLTVTEVEGSLSQGSIINFQMVDRRVRFELSLDSAVAAGLKLSTRLFGVATNVVKGTH